MPKFQAFAGFTGNAHNLQGQRRENLKIASNRCIIDNFDAIENLSDKWKTQ